MEIGRMNNSQNQTVYTLEGVAPCILSGGRGHDATVMKIMRVYEYSNEY